MSFATDTKTDTPLGTPVSTTLHAQLTSLSLSIFLKYFSTEKVLKICRPPSTAVARLVYKTLIAIFDSLDDVLRWARPFDKRPGDSVCNTNSPSFALNPLLDVVVRRIRPMG